MLATSSHLHRHDSWAMTSHALIGSSLLIPQIIVVYTLAKTIASSLVMFSMVHIAVHIIIDLEWILIVIPVIANRK